MLRPPFLGSPESGVSDNFQIFCHPELPVSLAVGIRYKTETGHEFEVIEHLVDADVPYIHT